MMECLSLGFLNFLVTGNSLSDSCILLLPLAPGHLTLAQEDLVVRVGISPLKLILKMSLFSHQRAPTVHMPHVEKHCNRGREIVCRNCQEL